MIDLHAHILPSIDDGASNITKATEMLEAARQNHISTIVATSHFMPHDQSRYMEAFSEVFKIANSMGITLLPGREYDLSLIDEEPAVLIQPLGNSKFVLIDLNQSFIPFSLQTTFCKIKMADFNIILAHPERMLPRKGLIELLDILKGNDVFIQVNTGSLLGRYGKNAQQNAFYILDHGKCHLLANDAHLAKHFVFNSCRNVIAKRYGNDYFELLTRTNPQRVLNNQRPLYQEPELSLWTKLKGLFS